MLADGTLAKLKTKSVQCCWHHHRKTIKYCYFFTCIVHVNKTIDRPFSVSFIFLFWLPLILILNLVQMQSLWTCVMMYAKPPAPCSSLLLTTFSLSDIQPSPIFSTNMIWVYFHAHLSASTASRFFMFISLCVYVCVHFCYLLQTFSGINTDLAVLMGTKDQL